jgi:hypothetical protein
MFRKVDDLETIKKDLNGNVLQIYQWGPWFRHVE